MILSMTKTKVETSSGVLTISSGNSKLRGIPNLNLPPIKTCVENPPCASLCYARKAYEGYARNTCGPAWDGNLALWYSSVGNFRAALKLWLERYKPQYFRWHSSGDIPDRVYHRMMLEITKKFPKTRFLCYSRRDYAWSDVESIARLPNLRIVRSVWLDETERPTKQPYFKVLPKDGLSMPSCPGSCAYCKACWHLEAGSSRSIVLH